MKNQSTARISAQAGSKASVKTDGKAFLGIPAEAFLQVFSEKSEIFEKKPAIASFGGSGRFAFPFLLL